MSGGPDCSLRLISFVGDKDSRPSGSVVLGPGSTVQSTIVPIDGNRCTLGFARMHRHDLNLSHSLTHLHSFPPTDTHAIYVHADTYSLFMNWSLDKPTHAYMHTNARVLRSQYGFEVAAEQLGRSISLHVYAGTPGEIVGPRGGVLIGPRKGCW